MMMVITLKSGVQIKAKVVECSTEGTTFGELKSLKWKTTDPPGTEPLWVSPEEIAAVHVEHEPGEYS